MASTRAFKNLASLRSSFDEPVGEEFASDQHSREHLTPVSSAPISIAVPIQTAPRFRSPEQGPQAVSPLTGKVDRRRLRKVLKTPSVSLSVAVRSELHEEIGEMLFARKTTWIALLDELLSAYVATAKSAGQYPK